jgi:hypothetical protein
MSEAESEAGRPIVFRGGTVLTMDDSHAIVSDGDVLVVGDSIAAVGTALEAPTMLLRSTRAAASSCPG